jgi:hypothetical protein
MAVNKIKLKPLYTVEESDAFAGKFLTEADCRQVYKEDVDIYDDETGKCIAKFRRGIIPANVCIRAYDALLKAASRTDSRGTATGEKEGAVQKLRVRKDGSLSNQTVSNAMIHSGVIGFSDRSARFPYCRLTAFNQHNMDKFVEAYPIIKFVDKKYSELMPAEYKKQKSMAEKTSEDFVIPNTAFTTVTVNKNWQTAVHKDAGDYREGFGNLVALRKGSFYGGHFVVVRWGCGFDLRNGDLLLVDVHQWHGNTPIINDHKEAVRLSLVMYYREKMIKCGTLQQELKRAKTRKRGDEL